MNRFKFKMHPLFLVFGCVFILTGEGIAFFVYALSIIFHEYVHLLTADFLCLSVENIELNFFGASAKVRGNTSRLVEEIALYLSAPLANGFIAIIVSALWYFFPEIVKGTEIIAIANMSLFFMNLLPIYPLDGGKIAYLLLSAKLSQKTAALILKISAVLTSIAALFLFTYLILKGVCNLTVLFLALFAFFGNFFVLKQEKLYGKCLSIFEKKSPTVVEKRVRVRKDASVLEMLKHVEKGKSCVFLIESDKEGGKEVKVLGEELIKNLASFSYNAVASEVAKAFTKN